MRISSAAIIASAALATTGVLAPAGSAHADVTDWTMQLTVRDTSWSELLTTNFLGCADLPIRLTVAGLTLEPTTPWQISGAITAADSTTVLEQFTFSGHGPQTDLGGISVPGVKMCSHIEGPVTPPNHEYVVTARATVPSSLTPEQPLTDRFIIQPMDSGASINLHEDRGGLSTLGGTIRVYSRDGFFRAAPVAQVTAQRLEGPTWVTLGTTTSATDGSYVIMADRLLPAGTYVRVLYDGTYWVGSHVTMPWPLPLAWKPPAPISQPVIPPPSSGAAIQPTPTVKVKAVSSRSKLKVDVNPNKGSRYWTFQVQKKMPDGTWKALKTYRTLGAAEKRTVNLPKGTYRVWVNPKFGHQGVLSAEVTLRR